MHYNHNGTLHSCFVRPKVYERHRISHGGLKEHLLERTADDDFRRVFQNINIKYYQSSPIMGLLRDNKQIIILFEWNIIWLSLENTKFLEKKKRIVALILLPYNNISIISKLKGHIKRWLISRISNF